jgi:hypothetical protein
MNGARVLIARHFVWQQAEAAASKTAGRTPARRSIFCRSRLRGKGPGETGRDDRTSVKLAQHSWRCLEVVSAAQRSLKQKGFYKGNIDGNVGPETRAAIREYQKNSNLNVTGRLDEATLSSLGVAKQSARI